MRTYTHSLFLSPLTHTQWSSFIQYSWWSCHIVSTWIHQHPVILSIFISVSFFSGWNYVLKPVCSKRTCKHAVLFFGIKKVHLRHRAPGPSKHLPPCIINESWRESRSRLSQERANILKHCIILCPMSDWSYLIGRKVDVLRYSGQVTDLVLPEDFFCLLILKTSFFF